jgi:hypothetical protein
LNEQESDRSLLTLQELLKDMQLLQFAELPTDMADAVF